MNAAVELLREQAKESIEWATGSEKRAHQYEQQAAEQRKLATGYRARADEFAQAASFIEQSQGVPTLPGTPEADADARNPNVVQAEGAA